MRGPQHSPHRELPVPGARYRHLYEHRGHGTVAIYSYGPAGEHDELVKEAKRVMRSRFGVTGAVSSGGCSGWPVDEYHAAADWKRRTEETQTIFSIHAVGGTFRQKLRQVPEAKADWLLEYTLNEGREFVADTPVKFFFSGPLEKEEVWQELVGEWTSWNPVIRARVTPTPQGLYWFLADDDPVAEWGEK